MADLTPKNIFEEEFTKKLQATPQIAKDINAVIQFDITGPQGGSWTADLTKSEGWVTAGSHPSPKMVVSVSDEDLIKIVSKQLNPNMAAMSGKLRFKPMDMGLALKLGKLF